MKIIKHALISVSALGLALTAFAQDKVTLSIATGPTTGVYYPLGGGIANVLSKYVPGYAANARPQSGLGRQPAADSRKIGHRAVDGRCRCTAQRSGNSAGSSGTNADDAYPNRMHIVTLTARHQQDAD